MRVAIFGYEGTYFSYFVHLAEEMKVRGHKVFFMHPRNIITRALFKRYGIPYHYNPNPKVIDGILSSDELNSITEYHIKFLSYKYSNLDLESSVKERAIAQASDFKMFFEKNKIDMVLIFNGSFYPSAAASVIAKKMGLATEFFENGFFPYTTQMDPFGVNYSSSTGKIGADFFKNIEIDRNKLDEIREMYFSKKSPPYAKNNDYPIDFLTKFYAKFIFLKYRGFHLSYFLPTFVRKILNIKMQGECDSLPSYKNQPDSLPDKPFIFIPLQVHDDSQIMNFSPFIENMQHFIDVIYRAVEDVFDDELAIVVKEHPVDVRRGYDYPEIREKYPDIYWFRNYDIKEIIEKCRFVITVNSTVGLESLLFYKPVVVLGKAVYGKYKISFPMDNIEELHNALEKANSEEVNKKIIDSFLYYFRYLCMLDGNFKYFDNSAMSNVVDKIEREFNNRVWKMSPAEIAAKRIAGKL
ncbi:hypothetical protein J7L68_03880 [bacterium]|nr:hypothetical protein [bacterium]